MGATSVTGVSGPGSAAAPGVGNKGSENMNLAVHRLIGPRVVMCGTDTVAGSGHATIYYPTLPGVASEYAVFLQVHDSADTTPTVPGAITTSQFGVTGGANYGFAWQIVKKGIWGSPVSALANT